jgi:two-component system, cell cycle sensor histidine kinase and response regulator CckA
MTHDTEPYRRLFESHPVAMAIWDPTNGQILAINDAAVHQYGYDHPDARELTIDQLVHPDDWSRLRERLASMPPGYVGGETFRHLRRDGSVIEVEMTGHDLLFEGRPCRVVMAFDVTERRRLEERLGQAQRMEAVGQLAGGIAHDFNNLLMVINGFSELLMARLPPGDQLEAAQQIRTAGDRAAALTKQLLTFASPGVAKPEVLNLADLIASLLPMLEGSLGVHVEVALDVNARDPWVEADRGHLEQVLVNLAVNAYDAMPDGGRLTIELADVAGDHPEAMASARGMLLLSVSDTGRGIAEEIRERVFLPFFTTKADRGSSGLGLATVFSTVRACGGRIWVEGAPTPGATIRVLLPRAATPADAVRSDSTGRDWDLARPSAILVTEDEPAVLTLIERVLSSAGYAVLTASSGPEALRVLAARPGDIDLLVSDAVMPGMPGVELARALRQQRPGLPVLFVSGWAGDAFEREWRDEPGVDLLLKPFEVGHLLERVEALLAGRPAERRGPPAAVG